MRADRIGRGRAGHTLVELLVVLAIIGLAASAAAPALLARREDDASRAARQLVGLLRGARATAAERAETVTLVLDAADGRAWAMVGDAPPAPAEPLALGGAAVEAAGPRARWTFGPTGVAYGDVVLLRGAAPGARAVRVRVDQWTGEPHAELR